MKYNERTWFIENDIFIRMGYNIDYAPRILKSTVKIGYENRYCEGTPVNRISNLHLKDSLLAQVCQAHMNQVVQASGMSISVSTYMDVLIKEIDTVIGPKVIDGVVN